MRSKKGMEAWLSWVLLVGFAVSLSVLVYYWVGSYTTKTTTETRNRYIDSSECEYISIKIEDACQNTQTLNINITNNNELVVNGLVFRLYTIFDEPDVKETNTTIRPEKKEEIELIKQGTIKKVEIIPIGYDGTRKIVCNKRSVSKTDIAFC